MAEQWCDFVNLEGLYWHSLRMHPWQCHWKGNLSGTTCEVILRAMAPLSSGWLNNVCFCHFRSSVLAFIADGPVAESMEVVSYVVLHEVIPRAVAPVLSGWLNNVYFCHFRRSVLAFIADGPVAESLGPL